jgi:hypothetical protein
MIWEREIGIKREVWAIDYRGYVWHETYGPSMTNWGSFYNIDQLLDRQRFINKDKLESNQGILTPGVNNFKELMNILIQEIEKEYSKRPLDEEVIKSYNQLPLIKNFIKDWDELESNGLN